MMIYRWFSGAAGMEQNSVRRPLAIIQLEAPPPAVRALAGEQKQWFVAALNLSADEYIVIRPDLGEALPDPATLCAAVLSGSWAMVTDRAEWSERTAGWIRQAVAQQLPLLGVCYGHQLMSWALGGEVADNPNGWERGLQMLVAHDGCQHDPLLSAFPAQFTAWLSHRQSVIQPPPGAKVLAASAHDGCQIIRYTPQALSVQFHPEFSAEIMAACLKNSLTPEEIAPLMPRQPEPEWPRQLLRDFWQQAQPQARRA